MASSCPKCRRTVDEDVICCASIEHRWKCKQCKKLSTGLVIPWGRCFLCGGENEVIERQVVQDDGFLRIIEDATRFELEMFHFYRLARDRTASDKLKAVFEELHLKEKDHIEELKEKYHLHLDALGGDMPEHREDLVASWIFQGVSFDGSKESVVSLYDRALKMERRTRDYFIKQAAALKKGPHRDLYRELAAEEEEHVAILDTEREQFLGAWES